jgi:hypothetical protein
MSPSCRRDSDNLYAHAITPSDVARAADAVTFLLFLSGVGNNGSPTAVPVERTTLLYKEEPELPRQLWHQPVDRPELLHIGLGSPTRNLPVGECGVSS